MHWPGHVCTCPWAATWELQCTLMFCNVPVHNLVFLWSFCLAPKANRKCGVWQKEARIAPVNIYGLTRLDFGHLWKFQEVVVAKYKVDISRMNRPYQRKRGANVFNQHSKRQFTAFFERMSTVEPKVSRNTVVQDVGHDTWLRPNGSIPRSIRPCNSVSWITWLEYLHFLVLELGTINHLIGCGLKPVEKELILQTRLSSNYQCLLSSLYSRERRDKYKVFRRLCDRFRAKRMMILSSVRPSCMAI